MAKHPNVLLIVADELRGDSIGADPQSPRRSDNSPIPHTPTIDSLAGSGALFERAYSPSPTCIPARRCLWTGQCPEECDGTHYHYRDWDFEESIPEIFSNSGYETSLVGKTHVRPAGKDIGFRKTVTHNGLYSEEDDYDRWLRDECGDEVEEIGHGLSRNAWDARPWHLEEYQHPTNWTTRRALETLDEFDSEPFFLTVSYVRPHPPFDPPRPYWEYYSDADVPNAAIGDWARERYGEQVPEYPDPNTWVAELPNHLVDRARRGYYGSITHIDHQIQRLIGRLNRSGLRENTIIIFTSDHGSMLGDHLLWRKGYALDGSARIPLVVDAGEVLDFEGETTVRTPVGLEDIGPSLLNLLDMQPPETMSGENIFDLLRDDGDFEREIYHGEHGPIYDEGEASQYLVDDQWKYIWNPVNDEELLFDGTSDPRECNDLSESRPEILDRYRSELISRLSDRSEGFVVGNQLQTVSPDTWVL
jgi:arylsulfatase A-like enzyme